VNARLLLILATAAAALAGRPSSASQTGELSAADRATIDSGRQILRQERVRHSAWPRVTVHQFIDATPEEAAAVFFDYGRHSTYIPGLERSVIARRITSLVIEVDYVLDVPFFTDEDYTVRDSLSISGDGTSYRVDWVKVRARSTKEIAGSARFERYRNARTGTDGTLLTYENLVVPGQRLAGPLKGRAIRQVGETATAVARQIESQRTGDRSLLATQLAALRTALPGVLPADR